jgi:hypothetical protein
LFDSSLGEGDPLASPVVNGTSLLVGVVGTIEPARVRDFDDPEVRERLVEVVHARRVEAARRAYLDELAAR